MRFKEFHEDWKARTFGEIFNYERPDAYIVTSEKYLDSNSTPVLTANKGFILGYTNETNTYDRPCIIFDDFTLESKYVDFPFMVKSSAIKILTIKNKNDDNLIFTSELLTSRKFEVLGHARHYISVVQPTAVLTPELKEQTQIGELFKKIDYLISLNQSKYDKLVSMKKACLEKMFPKDGADTPEIRFKGFSGKWERCSLGNASQTLEYGLNAAATKFDGTNKYIRITDIDDESRRFLESDLSSPDIDLSNADNYKLQKGDILFARTGASVGKTYIYNQSDGLVYFAGFLIRARIKPEYDVGFIFHNTLTSEYKKYIRLTSQRSGQPGVNAQEYAKFSFLVPQYEEQVLINKLFKNLDTSIALRKTELDKLKNIKKALLEKMFI